MKAMLADEVDINRLDTYLRDDLWVAQQKLDGDRLLIQVRDGVATALNRRGEPYRNPMPRKILQQFSRMQGDWTFDGELLDEFWIFDLPEAQVHVRPSRDHDFRTTVLERFFAGWAPDPCVRLLPTARTTTAKCELIEQLMARGGEGAVFKRTDAPYTQKRSSAMLKAKFTKTADVVVTAVAPDGRANLSYGMFDNGALIEVGSCATQGKPTVTPGQVIEVRYLYAGTDRRLVQPRMVRVRDDKSPSDCTVDQLRFTSREVLHLDDRPVAKTSASFVSRVLREAGIPKASPYTGSGFGREFEGFEVHVERGRITVSSTLRYEEGAAQIEEIRQALTARGLVIVEFPHPMFLALEVRGRRV